MIADETPGANKIFGNTNRMSFNFQPQYHIAFEIKERAISFPVLQAKSRRSTHKSASVFAPPRFGRTVLSPPPIEILLLCFVSVCILRSPIFLRIFQKWMTRPHICCISARFCRNARKSLYKSKRLCYNSEE